MSGASVVRPVPWIAPVREFAARSWDSVWGIALLIVSTISRVLCAHSKSMSRGVLFFLIVGTAGFTRDFSKLRIGPVYITELCMAVLLATVGTLLLQQKTDFLPRGRVARWCLYLVISYVVFGTVRLGIELLSGPSAGLLAVLRNFAVVYYATFAVIGWLVFQGSSARSSVRYILAATVLASTIISLWTVVSYLLGIDAASYDPTLDATVTIQGQAAAFAMLSILVAVNVIRSQLSVNGGLLRAGAIVILLLNIVYLYMSGHRSALVGCVAGAIMMLTGMRGKLRNRIRWRWAVLAVVVGALEWYFLAPHLMDVNVKFHTMSAPLEETNATWRVAFWLGVVFLWLSSPIFGVGFSHDFYDEDPLHLVQADHYDPHNSYLAILARTGTVGFLFVLAASFLFLRLLIRLVRQTSSEETALLGTCLLSCFAAMGTFAAANVTLESPYFALFFWLFIGMGIALAESERSEEKRPATTSASAPQ
jgi:O-antigen ligase